MKSQKSKIFQDTFLKVVKEDVTSANTGMGPTASEAPTQFSGDTYATGDSRLPSALGSKKVKGKKKIQIQKRGRIGM